MPPKRQGNGDVSREPVDSPRPRHLSLVLEDVDPRRPATYTFACLDARAHGEVDE
ncbi:MAG TPA: hypothetical protein VKG38_06565 [Solirubrobacteraceae bacterium]|nr:hypothetical protein [Solirubrobacteraceae bacterium]